MEKLTERLLLREFTKQDVDAIAKFRRDPRCLEYYYRPPTPERNASALKIKHRLV